MNDISLYIHIPFCKSKCLYCDFLSFANREEDVDDYVAALINEIKNFKTKSRVISIFIGGGTPSVIESGYIKKILDEIYNRFYVYSKAEITIEANPGTVSADKLNDYIDCGINRISFGVQAWQNRLLKTIGRIHNNDEVVRSIELAKNAGFNNINCDLMFSLPGQSSEDFLESINKLAELDITHISAYSLIVEEETPLYDMYESGEVKPIDDEMDRQMYHLGSELLEEKGYKQYEISNFAKQGFHCRHNIVYWRRGEHKGFGLGAASLINNVRLKNTENFSEYIARNNKVEVEKLTIADMQEEFMFLGLRCNSGVAESDFYNNFGVGIDEVYGEQIKRLLSDGLIVRENGHIYLTKYGFDLANMVFVEFMQ